MRWTRSPTVTWLFLSADLGAAGRGPCRIRLAACCTLAPLTDIAISIRLCGAPEQGAHLGGARAVSGPQSWSQWRHGPKGDGVGGHHLVAGQRSCLIVSKVRNHSQVLARSLLVDAASVLDPVMTIGKCLLAGLGGTWTSNCDTTCS